MTDNMKKDFDVKIDPNNNLAAFQAELDAERDRLFEERRQFEAEKAEKERLAKEAANAAEAGLTSDAALKTQQAAAAAVEAAEQAREAAEKIGRKRSIRSFIRGLILGLIAAAVACFFLGKAYIEKNYGTHTIGEISEDNVIEEHAVGFTAVDFQDAILGEAVGHSELIVMEEPMQLSTTLLKEGPWEWEVFRRAKNITYYGTGVYTVDLSKLAASQIKVDDANKKVTVTVPSAKLQYVNPDYEKIEFEDTDKGLLAFTDIKLTAEEQATLENSVLEEMRTHLSSPDLMASANEFAKMKIWELFQPLVTSVSPEYKVEVIVK
ncbi:MAG: DUF4230 domain-containing protein [Firmicutes bacterium]|nr:DUF4230 domain-containing protein [Bacillota bacterium]